MSTRKIPRRIYWKGSMPWEKEEPPEGIKEQDLPEIVNDYSIPWYHNPFTIRTIGSGIERVGFWLSAVLPFWGNMLQKVGTKAKEQSSVLLDEVLNGVPAEHDTLPKIGFIELLYRIWNLIKALFRRG